MKEKSCGLRSSIIILLVSVFISALFHFCSWSWCTLDYLVMLSVGASSSALVTLLIYLSEYKVAKVTTLENYWFTVSHVLDEFRKLEHYYFDIPLSLLKDYFAEQSHIFFVDSLIGQLPEGTPIPNDEFFQYRHDALERWCEVIEPNFQKCKPLMDEAKFKLMLSQTIERDADNYLKKLNKVIDEYILLSKISYKEAENAIGHIGYFTGKKPWEKLYRNIHKPIREGLKQVRQEAYHFGLYRSGEVNNIPVMLDKLSKLQKHFFKEVGVKNGSSVCVYNYFYDDMSNKLEDFRASIYNCEPVYQEPLCRYSFYKPSNN